ncbi:Six-hairpin glycosidase-like protein [Bombardia bombarda]|uniref:Six-hairpin glycosidase-like protein n=1 Tax=Bombardia bombarda TaxID=252184 RepID=A0AA40CFC6_9PEZI|nr:Six-hairpin glycosidase-like protein [Bombardia bombarda]
MGFARPAALTCGVFSVFGSLVAIGRSEVTNLGYHHLREQPAFPGPWEGYIQAPENKTHIVPKRVYKTEGNTEYWLTDGVISGISLGPSGVVTLKFEQNIGGRVCLDINSVSHNPVIQLAYSESSWFAGIIPDATTDRQDRDLPLVLALGNSTGQVCVAPEFVRGAFQYLTISLPFDINASGERYATKLWWDAVDAVGQHLLGPFSWLLSRYLDSHKAPGQAVASVDIANVWVNCTAFPSQTNGRAYSGYFSSSSIMLNRIWYAGAYTLQLSTIDPREGGALIDYNRLVDNNTSPTGSWYSNYTIANGTAVTTDGAKRDRMVYAGDMFIAIPGIAVSTWDMAAVRNALDVLYVHQYEDGSLPYAGPPMGWHHEFSDTYHMHALLGTYYYVLYTGDFDWLRARWPQYLRALRISIAKVDDELGLMRVSSSNDWLRPGLGGHSLEASAILHAVLTRSKSLVGWLDKPNEVGWEPAGDLSVLGLSTNETERWTWLQLTLARNIAARLYCPSARLFSDNLSPENHCDSPTRVLPQDGNSWVLISNLLSSSPLSLPVTPLDISTALRARWVKHGAPAPEFPNVISPFASGFELLAHIAAGQTSSAVELMLLEWQHLLDGYGFTNSTLAEGFRIDGHPQYPAYPSTARNSHAHGWSAGPTGVLTAAVVGIEFLEPAGRFVRVSPELTKWLGWVKGGMAMPDGSVIEVGHWRVVVFGGGVRGSEGRRRERKGVVVEVKGSKGVKGVFDAAKLLKEMSRRQYDGADESHFDFTLTGETNTTRTKRWVVWQDENDDNNDSMELLSNGERRKRARVQDISDLELLTTTETNEDDDDDEESWVRSRVLVLDDGVSELRYDDEFVLPEMEHREPGVVDWDVMERHFKTPPPAGWTVDELRQEQQPGREEWRDL